MFKREHNLPSPLNDLFTVNNTPHNHFTRQHADLHVNTGLRENLYSFFQLSWNKLYGTIFFPLMYHNACYKKLSKNYPRQNHIL